ncbi:Protein of unknown function [Gryllus bimaculatus]|nr:Protein of unknown function [Gryllus bimaculatus]
MAGRADCSAWAWAWRGRAASAEARALAGTRVGRRRGAGRGGRGPLGPVPRARAPRVPARARVLARHLHCAAPRHAAQAAGATHTKRHWRSAPPVALRRKRARPGHTAAPRRDTNSPRASATAPAPARLGATCERYSRGRPSHAIVARCGGQRLHAMVARCDDRYCILIMGITGCYLIWAYLKPCNSGCLYETSGNPVSTSREESSVTTRRHNIQTSSTVVTDNVQSGPLEGGGEDGGGGGGGGGETRVVVVFRRPWVGAEGLCRRFFLRAWRDGGAAVAAAAAAETNIRRAINSLGSVVQKQGQRESRSHHTARVPLTAVRAGVWASRAGLPLSAGTRCAIYLRDGGHTGRRRGVGTGCSSSRGERGRKGTEGRTPPRRTQAGRAGAERLKGRGTRKGKGLLCKSLPKELAGWKGGRLKQTDEPGEDPLSFIITPSGGGGREGGKGDEHGSWTQALSSDDRRVAVNGRQTPECKRCSLCQDSIKNSASRIRIFIIDIYRRCDELHDGDRVVLILLDVQVLGKRLVAAAGQAKVSGGRNAPQAVGVRAGARARGRRGRGDGKAARRLYVWGQVLFERYYMNSDTEWKMEKQSHIPYNFFDPVGARIYSDATLVQYLIQHLDPRPSSCLCPSFLNQFEYRVLAFLRLEDAGVLLITPTQNLYSKT